MFGAVGVILCLLALGACVLVSGESVCCVDVDGNGDGARAAAVGAGARVGAGFAVVGVAACFVTHEYVGAVRGCL